MPAARFNTGTTLISSYEIGRKGRARRRTKRRSRQKKHENIIHDAFPRGASESDFNKREAIGFINNLVIITGHRPFSTYS